MYCEGGRSRTGQHVASAKRGIGRLALESGAAGRAVPSNGSSHVRNWRRGRFPK
jgi:1-acyl-sn-glycerol-3-phosphate acyltransferase